MREIESNHENQCKRIAEAQSQLQLEAEAKTELEKSNCALLGKVATLEQEAERVMKDRAQLQELADQAEVRVQGL